MRPAVTSVSGKRGDPEIRLIRQPEKGLGPT